MFFFLFNCNTNKHTKNTKTTPAIHNKVFVSSPLNHAELGSAPSLGSTLSFKKKTGPSEDKRTWLGACRCQLLFLDF